MKDKNRITIIKEETVDIENRAKPLFDREFILVDFNLKPWKRKISMIRVVWDNSYPIKDFIDETISRLQKEGKYKRRTVKSVTVEYSVNKKL